MRIVRLFVRARRNGREVWRSSRLLSSRIDRVTASDFKKTRFTLLPESHDIKAAFSQNCITMSTRRHDANVFLHAKFNVHALVRLVERLRNRPCTCDLSQKPRSGSLNWAIILSFDDGVEWLFRSPRTYYGIGEETAAILLASEAATLKYIRENSSIPVPEVFHYRSVILPISESRHY